MPVEWVSRGCWKDRGLWSRAIQPYVDDKLKEKYGEYKTRVHPISNCAKFARDHGYSVFAVQSSGECFTSSDAEQTYNQHGKAKNCVDGEGGDWANDVYKIVSEETITEGYEQHFTSATSNTITQTQPASSNLQTLGIVLSSVITLIVITALLIIVFYIRKKRMKNNEETTNISNENSSGEHVYETTYEYENYDNTARNSDGMYDKKATYENARFNGTAIENEREETSAYAYIND